MMNHLLSDTEEVASLLIAKVKMFEIRKIPVRTFTRWWASYVVPSTALLISTSYQEKTWFKFYYKSSKPLPSTTSTRPFTVWRNNASKHARPGPQRTFLHRISLHCLKVSTTTCNLTISGPAFIHPDSLPCRTNSTNDFHSHLLWLWWESPR
jgi:hypothetical protein